MEAVICVVAAQIANLGESFIGAALQGKEGFRWVRNHFNNNWICVHPLQFHFLYMIVYILNTSLGVAEK